MKTGRGSVARHEPQKIGQPQNMARPVHPVTKWIPLFSRVVRFPFRTCASRSFIASQHAAKQRCMKFFLGTPNEKVLQGCRWYLSHAYGFQVSTISIFLAVAMRCSRMLLG